MSHTRSIPRLDLMIAYSCNIKCQGCISISDIPRNGVAPFEDITSWIEQWSKLISPDVIVVFGGEPLMHPKFMDICYSIRNAWPTCTIRVITNGYLLNRVSPEFWYSLGKVELQVSIHRLDHEKQITSEISKIVKLKSAWSIKKSPSEPGQHKQLVLTNDNIVIWKSYFKDFITPYNLVGDKFVPHSSNPADAHAICGSPNTPILYKGKLYKCPPVANLIDITGENWSNYRACDSIIGLDEFIGNINKPEQVCAQCPDRKTAQIYNHMDKSTVHVKLKNFS